MLNYEKWKLLNETLVPINLGFRPSHSLGITGAHLGQNTEEALEEEYDMDEVDFEAEDDMDDEAEDDMDDEAEDDMEFDGEDEDMKDGKESEMEMEDEEDEDVSGGCPVAKMSSEDEDEEEDEEDEEEDEEHEEHEHEGEDMDLEFESANNQSKTWWESVAGMVGTKGQYKNATELTEAAAKAAVFGKPSETKEKKEKEKEEEDEELVGKAALYLGKLKTFMNEHDVNAMNVEQVKGFIKGFCSYVLKNNKKVSPVTLKQELLSIAAQYGSNK